MTPLLITLGFAFIVVVLALMLLGIGWLLTGKSKIRPGACGRDPHKKREEINGCETDASCHLCKKPDQKKK